MTVRPLLLATAALLALAACDRGSPREENTAGANVVVEPPAPPPVENATAVKPPPVDAGARKRAGRIGRDGPGEERPPEYEGARTSATALPSQGDDATSTDATPPPPPPAPNSTGPQG